MEHLLHRLYGVDAPERHSLQVKMLPNFNSWASELQTYWRIVYEFDAVFGTIAMYEFQYHYCYGRIA